MPNTVKQFKIGLSATDKQNMAQDIYEQVEALLFSEYDSSETYNTGDYVVYSGQLYRCKEDNVTGAWNSAKWELATLQDLVDSVNGAVASVDNKANVDGNYTTLTAGLADNLTPYDDESGDDQDETFNFQATGTGNGTQPDFATGSYALLKEKQGNTIVVNQLADCQSDYSTQIPGNNISSKYFGYVPTNKYLISFDYNIQATIGDIRFMFGIWNSTNTAYKRKTFTPTVLKGRMYAIISNLSSWEEGSLSDYSEVKIIIQNLGDSINSSNSVSNTNVHFINLDQWFNGNIPQDLLDNPSHFSWYYNGSLAFNTGTLVNANSQYIKCIGMNQWDEEWEIGGIDYSTGQNVTASNRIRSKNYIKIIPGKKYYLKTPVGSGIAIYSYDKDKNFIGYGTDSGITSSEFDSGETKIITSNISYIRFICASAYGTTYNNDISINLYYEDEARCLTYEPYEVLTNNDTGTEVLRSAGSVRDSKLPSGEITRRIGSYTFTGSESWSTSGNGKVAIIDGLSELIRLPSANSDVFSWQINNAGLVATSATKLYSGAMTSGIGVNDTGAIFIGADDYANISNLTGKTIYFELATPTTEQGTLFSENLIIDDFGTMSFEGTSGVPQGNLIFYPVDYKAFDDTLYKYTEGTPSKLALKSDTNIISSFAKENIGGILRHMISGVAFANTDYVDLGTLTFLYDSTNHYFYASLPQAKNTDNATNFLCSKYGVIAGNNMASQLASSDKIVCISTYLSPTNNLIIKDTSYSSVDTFAIAINGIILAYEKA